MFSKERKPQRRRMMLNQLAGVAAAVLAVATVAACSSSGGGSTSNSTSNSTSASLPKLTVVVGLYDPVRAAEFVGVTQGFFKKAGVDVTVSVSSNTLTSLASGQADLDAQSVAAAFSPVVQGKSTSIIFGTEAGGLSASLVVASTSTAHSILDLAGKRVAISGSAGAPSYGYAQIYNAYLKSHGKAPMQIIPEQPTEAVDGVVAGSVSAMVGSPTYFAGNGVVGKVRFLINGSTAAGHETLQQLGISTNFFETSVFGLTSNLQKKRTAVTRFVLGLQNAYKWIKATPSTQVAESLRTFPGFDEYGSIEEITRGINLVRPFYAPTNGKITPAIWTETLAEVSKWDTPGVTNLTTGSQWTYQNRVDMSYLNDADAGKYLLTSTK
jgi:ABC-type nitrate/sulfonate/bicarbonate transport system substrate-binding protein